MSLAALALAVALNAVPSNSPSRAYHAQVDARLHAAFGRAAAAPTWDTEPAAKPVRREGRTPRPAGR